ncbi:MAG: serine/threonine protein kinase, partial [Myxococcales bacterium]|nr:serine/threonine protein kinase [Myxococcales bacterium]
MAGDVGTLAAGTNVDQFTIVRLIGRGGMGEVYLAQDQSLGRRVALKLISFEHALGASNVLRARFLYEARTTARFSHPNIVAIYAVGEHQERPYMALEYLEGESLRERIARAGVPAPAEALRIGGAIAAAIAEAHRHGVLHRDLKPGNVMLCDDGRARVVDFGLAMGVAASVGADGQLTSGAGAVGPTPAPAFEHTHTGLRGTPHYMAPELWKEADATPATDVWALGVVLMQLFTGRLPYGDQRSLFALAANVASADPVPGL